MITFLTLLSILTTYSYGLSALDSIQIRNINLSKCDKNKYPVNVYNLNAKIKNAKVSVTGSLNSSVDLISPISAKVYIERDVLGVWIPIPCVEHKGSCDYLDLCKFGIPKFKKCPPTFLDNNVPCRCPIAKGNYTISPRVSLESSINSIETGKYKGTATVAHNKNTLACYNFYFELYDASAIKEQNEEQLVEEDFPFVTIV